MGLFNRLQGELEARERSPGLSMADLLTLPEPEGGTLRWMLRQGKVSLPDLIAFLGQDEERTRALLADLCERGFVREIEIQGVLEYRVRLAPKRGRTMPANLWEALEGKCEGDEEGGR